MWLRPRVDQVFGLMTEDVFWQQTLSWYFGCIGIGYQIKGLFEGYPSGQQHTEFGWDTKYLQQCKVYNNACCATMWVLQQCKSYECSIVFSQDRSIDWRAAFIPRAINIRGRHIPITQEGATTYHSIRRPHAVSHSYFWFKTCFCLVFVLVYSQCVW